MDKRWAKSDETPQMLLARSVHSKGNMEQITKFAVFEMSGEVLDSLIRVQYCVCYLPEIRTFLFVETIVRSQF